MERTSRKILVCAFFCSSFDYRKSSSIVPISPQFEPFVLYYRIWALTQKQSTIKPPLSLVVFMCHQNRRDAIVKANADEAPKHFAKVRPYCCAARLNLLQQKKIACKIKSWFLASVKVRSLHEWTRHVAKFDWGHDASDAQWTQKWMGATISYFGHETEEPPIQRIGFLQASASFQLPNTTTCSAAFLRCCRDSKMKYRLILCLSYMVAEAEMLNQGR